MRVEDMSRFAQVLSSFDDFPVHQTSQPIAQTASADLNHYDRYFFNGYTRDTRLYFAAAMGLYPNRHVADAAFSVVVDGGTVEHGRSTSTRRGGRRPTAPTPTRSARSRSRCSSRCTRCGWWSRHPSTGCAPTSRSSAARHRSRSRTSATRSGVRVMFDYTRLTQFGGWEGWVEIDGELIDLEPGETWGSRDRSWGVRPVGERGSTGAPIADPQFFWLWAPINFETFSTHFDVNELFDGKRWHETGVIAQVDTGDGVLPEAMRAMDYRVGWTPGTRYAEWFEIDLVPWIGEPSTIRLEPLFHFQMLGIGYGHPEWGHGVWKGELAVGGDRWDLPIETPNAYEHVHIQAIVRATTTGGVGEHEGIGILEQLALGRHVPTGLDGLLDGYEAK